MAKRTIQPIVNDVIARIKKILKLEYPYTFKERRSLLFRIDKRNHMPEINIINGSNLIIMLGIYNEVKVRGNNISVLIFFKNSISSKRFKIIPKQKNINITFEKVFKNPKTKY
tara:strand:+ start:542 stop:880 length:339 start_codon:yes stop_codon:yes gene_type:complete